MAKRATKQTVQTAPDPVSTIVQAAHWLRKTRTCGVVLLPRPKLSLRRVVGGDGAPLRQALVRLVQDTSRGLGLCACALVERPDGQVADIGLVAVSDADIRPGGEAGLLAKLAEGPVSRFTHWGRARETGAARFVLEGVGNYRSGALDLRVADISYAQGTSPVAAGLVKAWADSEARRFAAALDQRALKACLAFEGAYLDHYNVLVANPALIDAYGSLAAVVARRQIEVAAKADDEYNFFGRRGTEVPDWTSLDKVPCGGSRSSTVTLRGIDTVMRTWPGPEVVRRAVAGSAGHPHANIVLGPGGMVHRVWLAAYREFTGVGVFGLLNATPAHLLPTDETGWGEWVRWATVANSAWTHVRLGYARDVETYESMVSGSMDGLAEFQSLCTALASELKNGDEALGRWYADALEAETFLLAASRRTLMPLLGAAVAALAYEPGAVANWSKRLAAVEKSCAKGHGLGDKSARRLFAAFRWAVLPSLSPGDLRPRLDWAQDADLRGLVEPSLVDAAAREVLKLPVHKGG